MISPINSVVQFVTPTKTKTTIAATSLETSKWTIAPNYAITESLGAILEYSNISRDVAASADSQDSTEWALELTYTF